MRLAVGLFDYEVVEVPQAEADAWWEQHRPTAVQVPGMDLAATELRDDTALIPAGTTQAQMRDAVKAVTRAYGGKAAHFGALTRVPGVPIPKGDIKNEWDLKLANTPMSLNIKAGAYDGSIELGGLSLEKLAISDGGADVTAKFSAPNNVEMSSFTYPTGASNADLKGLANANFERMTFSSGAGDYMLSFDGDLQRDAGVAIDSGLGTVTLIIPDVPDVR